MLLPYKLCIKSSLSPLQYKSETLNTITDDNEIEHCGVTDKQCLADTLKASP